jgi:hypothetical protein
MLHGEHLDVIAVDAIDHSVVLDQNLADVVEFVFGYNATTAPKHRESIGSLKDLVSQASRLSR